MKHHLLPGILAMAAIVVASNILVQFLFGQWLTWGAFTYPLALACGTSWGATGVMLGYAAAAVLAGSVGAWLGWRYVCGLRDRARPLDAAPPAP